MSTLIIKDPGATLDFKWDWSAWLDNGETITAATVTAPTGLILNPAPHTTTYGTGMVTAWLAGGSVGERHAVVCHITTSAGRQDERSLRLRIVDR